MNFKAMNMFLSEDNIKRHIEHLRTLKLKYSIIEKSNPIIASKSMREVATTKMRFEDREEVLNILWQINAHECYFNSFSDNPKRCNKLKEYYSSPERFIYEVYMQAEKASDGFLFLHLEKNGRPIVSFSDNGRAAFIKYQPVLALDLCEHAYFCDYGFRRDKYIRSALTYFDLARLYSLDNRT